jgi:hypothetical protein
LYKTGRKLDLPESEFFFALSDWIYSREKPRRKKKAVRKQISRKLGDVRGVIGGGRSREELAQLDPDIWPCFWAYPIAQRLAPILWSDEAVHLPGFEVYNPVFPDLGRFVER